MSLLSHTYTAFSQKDGSGCWRKGTTTIAFQKNAEWNPNCWARHKHAQNWPKYTGTQTNALKMKYNTVTNKQHTPTPSFKSSSNIHALPMCVKDFYSIAEFASWIILVFFKQNWALKITGFRWEEQHGFYSTRETYGTDRAWRQVNAESDMSKKSSNCSTQRNLLCVGKREQLSWKAKRNCRIVQGWQPIKTVMAEEIKSFRFGTIWC